MQFTVTESHRNKVAYYNEKKKKKERKLSALLWIRMASTVRLQTWVKLPRSLEAYGNCQEGMLRSRRNFLALGPCKSQQTRNTAGGGGLPFAAVGCIHKREEVVQQNFSSRSDLPQ